MELVYDYESYERTVYVLVPYGLSFSALSISTLHYY